LSYPAVVQAKKETERHIKTASLGEALFFIQLLVLITQSYFFPDYPISWQMMIVYMMIPIGLMVYSKRSETLVQNVSLYRSVLMAVIGFWVTYALVLLVYGVLFGLEFGEVSYYEIWPIIVAQVIFVAPSEEIMFRLVLPDVLQHKVFPKKLWLGALILSQILFAFFHIAAYQGSVGSMTIAFTIGMLWLFASRLPVNGKPLGIGFTIGSHIAYNLIIAGILVGNWGLT
jgi:membrane protease YdiL (CAAX protease family)